MACGIMIGLTNISDELINLSKEIVETIENEDREFDFKLNNGYVERNVPASKFKKKILGLSNVDINEIISNKIEE